MMRNFSTIFFIVHFCISPGLAITLDQNVGPLAVQDLFFPGFNETYHLPGHVLFNVEPKRFRRSTDDPLNTVILRMQTLSSVTNAVALQIGLLADTIPHYDVIAELLHFDHVKSSDFKNPIANDVETILNSFATLPDQFEKDVTDVLTAFEGLLGIKGQISGVKDVKSWKSEGTLQSDLEDLGTNGLILTSYVAMQNPITMFSSKLLEIGELITSNTEEKSPDEFAKIVTLCNRMLSEPANFQKKINSIVKLKSGGKAVDSFSDMLTISRTIKTCKDDEQKLKFKPEGDKKLNNNIALVSTVSKQSLELSSYLETVLKVLAAPSTSSSYRALVYTAGLPNGFEDLKSVPFHKSDTWLESITDTTSLFKALTILDLFIEKVRDVSQQLSFYRGQKPSPIDTVNSFVKSLDSSTLLHKDADPVLKEVFRLLSEVPKSPKIPTLVDLEPLNKEIAKIDTAVESIRASMGKSIEILTNNEFVKMINEIKKISGKAAPLTDKQKLKELIEELLNYKRKPELDQKFTDFTIQFNNVKTEVSGLKTLAKDVKIKLADTMKNFQTPWDLFKNFLDGLRNLDATKVDVVKKLITRSTELQTPMPDSVKREVSKVVDVVTKLQTMTDLSAVINNMKSQETEESKQFLDLVDSEKLSEVIGTATRGIVNFKDLSERKSQFELIQKLLPSMETDISSRQGLTQPEIESPIELKKLQKMSDDLEKWRSGVKLPNPDTIPNYADIFVGGLDLTSENINEPIKLSETLGNLESTTADPNAKKNYQEMKTALDELNSVGVKLSVYKDAVTKTRDTLNSLNTYFANHQKKVVTIPVQKATPLSVLTSTGFREVTTIAGSWASENVWLIALIVGLAIGVPTGCASVIAYFCCGWRPCQKKKKKKGEMNKGEKTPLIEPATPPPKQSVNIVDETKNETAKPEKKDEEKDEKKEEKKEDGHEEKKVKEEEVQKGKTPREPIQRNECLIHPETFVKLTPEVKGMLLEYQVKKRRSPDVLQKETLIYFCSTAIRNLRSLEVKKLTHKKYAEQIRTYPVYCNPDEVLWLYSEFINKVYHEDRFVNGAAFTFDNGSTWYMCETPIVPTKKNPNRTDDKFALLVAQVEADAAVFICDKSELESKSEPTYGQYFPKEENHTVEMALKPNNKKLVMKCLEKKSLYDGQLIVRRIKITFKDEKAPVKEQVKFRYTDKEMDQYSKMRAEKTEDMTRAQIELQKDLCDEYEQRIKIEEEEKAKKKHEHLGLYVNPNDIDFDFTHYQLIGWKAGSVPEDTVPLKELMKLLRGKSNVILHCSDGIERCGTLTYIEALRQECSRKWEHEEQNVQIGYINLADKIQGTRPGALSLYIHQAFSIMILVDIVKSTCVLGNNASDLQAIEIYEKLHELYRYALDHREAVDPVKDEEKETEEPKKKEDATKETKKPTETVDASKPVEKPADTKIQEDKTQESDPLLEKPSLKEQKTQK
ncbi:hypothetical protein CAEBREN_06209 [Caenorhabditis brenneri]|uniref:Tyrosine-protein phosphatase domain-containing protein n=1 Tax=Caenorhabditis brenneri TaxID=135651 RepID=G0PK07_CAEBE|nr:hypothetical protein CAEBREN_06209 [Caenorhabditis brenneri]